MVLTNEKKQEIFKKFGKSKTNSGSPESQIALFTHRINHLTDHLKLHQKDFSTQRSLLKLVGHRRRQLDYLKDTDITRYRDVIKSLNLRK
jgi:small subunit ribosomal protein S15